jgi:flagellar hook protein FlgE
LTGTTQFASSFAVTAVVQDGFTTGELAGLSIDDEGLLVARYTNGQTRTQGQVVLANFANQQGLTPLGDTAWAQSSASGEPVVGAPQSGTLGAIQSGALEQSNVDLSEQLINLIIAQRNYQANAKTIQTEDAVTQTIINLR